MTYPFPLRIRTFTAGLAACLWLAAIPAQLSAQSAKPVYRWTTLAGRASLGVEDGPAADARFKQPHGLAMDLAGNLYVADTGNHTIRKISPTGIVTTFAGSAGQSGSADGAGSAARFNAPEGIGADPAGNLYVADTCNHTIRKITPAGVVRTLAGQAGQAGTADGAASAALFDAPNRLSVDANGTVYLYNNGFRKIAGGQVQTLNLPTQAMDRNGQSQAVNIGAGPAVDAAGQLYFRGTLTARSHPFNQCILKLDAVGNLTVTLDPGYSEVLGWGDYGIFNDVAGNLYVTHSYRGWGGTPGFYEGRGLLADGIGTTGTPAVGFISCYGGIDDPQGVAVDHRTGRWYYTRGSDDAIRGGVNAGTPRASPGIDGQGAAARFANANSLAVDSAGAIWVADHVLTGFEPHADYSLRKVTPTGLVSTAIPPRFMVFDAHASDGSVTADGAGNIYFSSNADLFQTMTQVNASSGATTPMAIDRTVHLFVTAISANSTGVMLGLLSDGDRVHKRNPDGSWSVLAGGSSAVTLQDGSGASVKFGHLSGLTSDSQGDFYVLDFWDWSPTRNEYTTCVVRKVTATGTVATLTPNLGKALSVDGSASLPESVAVDSQGTLYLVYSGKSILQTDTRGATRSVHYGVNTIRRITRSGEESVIGSSLGIDGSADGLGDAAQFARPTALAVDKQDNLLVIDGYGTTIRKGEFLGYTPGLTGQPQSATVTAGGTVQFAVTASGTPPPTYQWYRGGNALTGATGNTLTLSNVRTSDAGDYTVVVTNSLGSVPSNKATLTVTTAPTPPAPPVSGGGGGAISGWSLAACLMLWGARRFSARRG